MPNTNFNNGAAYIMGSDKTSVDDPMGSNQLNWEGMDFDMTNTGIDISRMDFNRKGDVDLDVKPEYRQYKNSILRNLKL